MTEPVPVAPALTFVCRLAVDIGTPIDVGPTGQGRRRFMPVVGGTVHGPWLNGRVLAGGGDWQTVRNDGVVDLAARYPLELVDGSSVEFDNRGLRHGAAPGRYFQTTARLSASTGPHEWLNRTVFIAAGRRGDDGVYLELFAVGNFSAG